MRIFAIVALAMLLRPVWADDLPKCGAPGLTPAKAANPHVAEDYPPVSLALGEEGTTTVEFTITPDGTPAAAKVAKSSGSMRLDQASLDSILGKWRYTPARSGDTPIACIQNVEVKWVLDENKSQLPAYLVEIFRKNAVKMKLEDYPESAREKRQEGIVLVRVEAGEDGRTSTLIFSSGFPDLDRAALRIIPDRVKLSAADCDGQTFEAVALIPVLWSLDGVSGK